MFDCRWLVFSLAVMLLGADSVLAQCKMDHLLKACSHLEQAGFPEMAAEIREISRQREWQETLGTVKQLQTLERLRANRARRIGLRLKVLEFSPKKLREMGFPLVSIQLLLDNDAPTSVVDETGSLGKFIEFLHEQKLMELICEPAMATIANSPVSVSLDSRDVGDRDESGVAHQGVSGACARGIRFDCLPRVAENGRLDLEIRSCQTDGASARPSDSEGSEGTGSDVLLEIETRVEMEFGQRVILCGRRCRDKQDEDIGVLVLLTAGLVGSPQVFAGAE